MSIKKFTLTRQRKDPNTPFYPELPNTKEKLSALTNFICALPGVIEYNSKILGNFCITELIFDSDILPKGEWIFTQIDQDPVMGEYHLEIVQYYRSQPIRHFKDGKFHKV